MIKDEGTDSKIKIFGNIFISFIGAGILGLPYAFKEAGLIEGFIIMTLVGLFSVKAMLLVVDCKDKLVLNTALVNTPPTNNGKPLTRQQIDYGEVGYAAFGTGGKLLVDISIILSQVGFTCAYLIFISENLFSLYDHIPKIAYLLCLLLPLTLLSNLRHLKYLAPFSLFADVANVSAYSIVFWFDMKHLHLVNIHVRTISLSGLPFFIGVAIYCYEGAGMVLSLEQSVLKESKGLFKRMFKLALLLVTMLYVGFGIMGYLSFGPDTQEIITLNLPDGPFPLIVKTCLCLALFFTYPMMMFPVSDLLERRLSCNASPTSPVTSYLMGSILRTALVLLTGLIVVLIPKFSTLMALVGSTCCTLLGLILPAMFHMKLFKSELSTTEYCLDVLLIIIGIVGTIVGTKDALQRIFSQKTTSIVEASPSLPPTTTSANGLNHTLRLL